MKPLDKPNQFDDLRKRIQMNAELTHSRRKSMASRIKRFGEVIGKPLSQIPCDTPYVRQLMNSATPAAYNVSPGNWASIKCDTWRALEIVGYKMLRSTGIEPTEEIASMLDGVPRHPDQTELTPLLKFLIEQELSPSLFTQAHVSQYRDWLQQQYVRANWSRAMKTSLKRWSKCQKDFADRWPQAPVQPEYEEHDWALPWARMSRFEVVVDAHLADLRKPKKRRHGGNLACMKESTILARKGYLRRMASAIFFATKFVPETLEDVTNPDNVEAAVDYIMVVRKIEQSGDIHQMLRHVNAIARHHVDRSKQDIDDLKGIRKSVAPPPGPAEKNRKLIEKFRNPELRKLFLVKPTKVLRSLARKTVLSDGDLREGMLAFAAALLTKVPMRASELMALEYGKTFHDHGAGKARTVIVDLPAHRVKNGVPRYCKLGPKLVALLDIYTGLIRKHMTTAENPFLFPNASDDARSADHMSKQLAAWTTKHVIRMTAHQWRHVVGYIFLLANPGCYDTVRRFLGHTSVSTTVEYYAFVLEDDANEALDQTIDDLTDKAAKSARRIGKDRKHAP